MKDDKGHWLLLEPKTGFVHRNPEWTSADVFGTRLDTNGNLLTGEAEKLARQRGSKILIYALRGECEPVEDLTLENAAK